ncbi:ubiquitin, partial [Leptodontidium sp. 2 PMI_412]
VQFFVRNVAGKTLTFLLNPLDLVSHVKEMIYAKDECPCDKQRLIYAGKQLEDDRTLADYGIMRQSTIFLVYSLRGGG